MVILKEKNISINGILHLGAHECEEFRDYINEGMNDTNIFWIEANPDKVQDSKERGIPNVYCQAIDNKKGVLKFHITNNGQSSSLLEFGTHATSYPYIHIVETKDVEVDTLKNWVEQNKIPIEKCEFWNFDIQGKELDALKSAGDYIHFAKALYLEVNIQEVYKGCALLHDIDMYVKQFGFMRVKLALSEYGWGDALYIKV